MTTDDLNELAEETLRRNRAAIKQAREGSRQRRRLIERSALAIEQAIRRLRQSSSA
jgi:hypothetical protein